MSAPALPAAEVAGEGLTIEEWLDVRKSGIGASEISAVLGVNPWESPISLYLKKRGEIEDSEDNESMLWGRVLEQPIREQFTERTGIVTVQPPTITIYRSKALPIALASPDGLAFHEWVIDAWYEGKTTDKARGDDWEDGIPLHYEAQAQYQLAVSGLPVCHVAVLIGGNRMKTFEIAADPLIGDDLFEAAERFWKMVQDGVMPDADASEVTRKALTRRSGELIDVVQLDEEFLDLRARIHTAKVNRAALAELVTGLENELLVAIGDHREAWVGDVKVASLALIPGGHVEFDRQPYRRLTVTKEK